MALFFVPGIVLASWVSRTPDIRDAFGASHAQMGLVLMGLSVGSMVGILASGPLVARFSTRKVIAVAATMTALSVPVLAIGAGLASPWLFALGLCLGGLAMGGGEVAMNVEGAEVEVLAGRPFLPKLHAFFSIGATIGATLGIAFTHFRVPVEWHLGGIALVTFAIVPLCIGHIPRGVGLSGPRTAGDAPRGPLLTDARLLLIGVIMLALALAEGSANDWLPLVMVDGHGFDPALGSASYAIFAGCMAVGRLFGGPLVTKLGQRNVLLVSSVAGAVGLALVIFVDNQLVAGLAVIAWGLGAALGFPVAVSAAGSAGEPGPDAARRVSFVATIGYIAFLAGPPVLGLLGEAAGLRRALILVMVLCIISAVLVEVLRRQSRTADEVLAH
ncbi:MFS transporter [Tessaracoccus rhinocerotis]|uniref:MFS transporter n=2 Tax=Tessaracoccus rhinocerotis TaxID=1689449 RepID=A0A553K6E4_9ACTN|nr:MFS transporter [Tessaracoccus rhinocerotis]